MFHLFKPQPKHYKVIIVSTTDAGEHRYCLHEIDLTTFESTALCHHMHTSKSEAKHCPDTVKMRNLTGAIAEQRSESSETWR